MKTSLLKFRHSFLDDGLAMLWRQWTLLGVPGQEETLPDTCRIIDPEALLLLTSELGRFDARLFDEVLNWLRQNGRLINIQRLKSLHLHHSLGNVRVLSAIAATLRQNSRLAKWAAIQELTQARDGEEPLFLHLNGSPLPRIGRADPVFKKFGYFRGVYRPRDDAFSPRVQCADLLLMKLRALLGVNARAEILTALLTTPARHPSALARRTGYLPRSIQDVLNEMALSGHIVGERTRGSREKFFSLRPGDWDFLKTWTTPGFPEWMDWPVLFSLTHRTLEALCDPKTKSTLATALQLRQILDESLAALSEAGLSGHFAHSLQSSRTEFLDVFLAELAQLTFSVTDEANLPQRHTHAERI